MPTIFHADGQDARSKPAYAAVTRAGLDHWSTSRANSLLVMQPLHGLQTPSFAGEIEASARHIRRLCRRSSGFCCSRYHTPRQTPNNRAPKVFLTSLPPLNPRTRFTQSDHYGNRPHAVACLFRVLEPLASPTSPCAAYFAVSGKAVLMPLSTPAEFRHQQVTFILGTRTMNGDDRRPALCGFRGSIETVFR